jgi:glycosyltransferase involved in cell wall biosynthesis
MLYIVARLKNKYPDIQYIIQGSENPHTMEEHDKVYSRIINIAEELDILENITINRGFVNRDILLSFIRTVKCCILPYTMHPEHNVRGTSGIARLIIGTTTPLITSNVHLFDDLDGIAIRCNDDEQIYEAIDDIFNNDKEKLNQMNNRKKFLFETSWKRISKKLYNIYEEILENDA